MDMHKRCLWTIVSALNMDKDSESEKPVFSCSHPSNADHKTSDQNDH